METPPESLYHTIVPESQPGTLCHTLNEDIKLVSKTSVTGGEKSESGCTRTSLNPAYQTSYLLRANFHFAALCWTAILAGWNDGSNGPLLPRIQQEYRVGYTVVSLIFVFSTLGYISGSVSSMFMMERFTFGTILVIGSVCQVIAYCIDAAAAPFPALMFAYTVGGFGQSLQAAQLLGYIVRYKDNPGLRMSLVMTAYGVGALLSPLSATYFVRIPHWSYHYLTSLGIAVLNSMFLIGVFRLRSQEACLADIGITDTQRGTSDQSIFRQVLGLKDVHFLAAFVFCYIGIEVTLGGWIVSYIIEVRHGGPSSGYISTGFWAAATIGRLALIKVSNAIGELRALFVYAILAIMLEFVVWFVPSLIGDAIAVVCIGMLLGPMYPTVVNHAGRVLPQWLLTGSMGWISGVGQAGSAFIPFITGVIADRAGIKALNYVLVAMFIVLTGLWMAISRLGFRG